MSARLVAVFVVASLTGLVFGGLRVADAVGAASGYTRIAQLADLGKQVTLLAQDLENERDHTVGVAALTALQVHAAEAKAGPAVVASLRRRGRRKRRSWPARSGPRAPPRRRYCTSPRRSCRTPRSR